MIFLPRKTDSRNPSKHTKFKTVERVIVVFFNYKSVSNSCCFQFGRNKISGKNLVNCLLFNTNPQIFPKYENKHYPIIKPQCF